MYQGLLKKAKHQFSEAFADENRLVNNFHIAKLKNLHLFKSCFYVTSPADYSLSVSNFAIRSAKLNYSKYLRRIVFANHCAKENSLLSRRELFSSRSLKQIRIKDVFTKAPWKTLIQSNLP